MGKPNLKGKNFKGLLGLGLIWSLGAAGDRLWFALDRSVPAWDQADYLTGALNYWRALQHPLWFTSDWWTSLWLLSSKIPPLTYILTAGFLNLFGTGSDRATLVNLFFSAVLLGSVYGLGTQLFNPKVGLWAAGLCVLFPGLYLVRLDFLLDYPLAAVVTLCFFCLTVWRGVGTAQAQRKQLNGWLWATAFGLCLGLALLVKQTAVFFLLTPLVWVFVETIRRREWRRVAQLVWSLVLSAFVFGPWYRTNWLLILTSGKRATLDAAIAEGDPALHTLDAWTFYLKDLPYIVSWPLLLVPVVGFLLYWIQKTFIAQDSSRHLAISPSRHLPSFKWLAIFGVGAYLFCSLNINKDSRYVFPYLPVLSLFLAYGLILWPRRWGTYVRWGTVGLAILLMFLNLWPIGGSLGNFVTQLLSPRAQHHADLRTEWPHQQVIAEIIQSSPFLRSTLGVLPSTPEINQHNFNYYGALANFQVYGRQVGTRKKQLAQDARSLSWFLTKTGDQGSVNQEAQSAMVRSVEQSPDFQLQKTWPLPDNSILKLYRQRLSSVEVKPLASERIFVGASLADNLSAQQITFAQNPPLLGIGDSTPIHLDRVTLPKRSPPGVPMPVTYEWSGSWEQLQPGIVLLTWRSAEAKPNALKSEKSPHPPIPASKLGWLHDRAIGMGALHPSGQNLKTQSFQVIERTATLPPASASGYYTLEATYLNRETGKSYPIAVPPVRVKIDPAAAATPAPELDWVTQLRTLAAGLRKGPEALGPIFEEIGRINQYDPIQDYTVQTERSLEYRLQQEPQNLEWSYALALARGLRRDAKGAIAALERVVELDSQNPYAYCYLAVVHLYDWHPKAAEAVLVSARAISPNLPEIKAIGAVAALMQGNLMQVWQDVQSLKGLLIK